METLTAYDSVSYSFHDALGSSLDKMVRTFKSFWLDVLLCRQWNPSGNIGWKSSNLKEYYTDNFRGSSMKEHMFSLLACQSPLSYHISCSYLKIMLYEERLLWTKEISGSLKVTNCYVAPENYYHSSLKLRPWNFMPEWRKFWFIVDCAQNVKVIITNKCCNSLWQLRL